MNSSLCSAAPFSGRYSPRGSARTDVVLVLNWLEELNRLVPTD